MKDNSGCAMVLIVFFTIIIFIGYALVQSFATLFGINFLFNVELMYTNMNLFLAFCVSGLTYLASQLFLLVVKGIIKSLEELGK